MLGRPSHAQDCLPVVLLGPDRAARLRPVLDYVRNAAQRDRKSRYERHRCWQARKPRAIQAAFRSAKARASCKLPRRGMVSTAWRLDSLMRKL